MTWLRCGVIAVLVASWGCAAYPGSDAGGDVSALIPIRMEEAADAVRRTTNRLRLTSVVESGDVTGATLVAFDPHGSKVIFRLEPAGPTRTEVSVGTRLPRDSTYAHRILSEMKRQSR
jgi:hypothetical protein